MQRAFDNDSLPIPPLAMSLVQQPERKTMASGGQTFSSWSRNSGDGNVGKLDGNTTGFLLGGQIANWRTITCVSAATSATAG